MRAISDAAGWLAIFVVAASGCADRSATSATAKGATAPYITVLLRSQMVAAERRVDGRIEAVNQGTVSAQTDGEIVGVVRDAGDPVAANGVVMRIRAVQQRLRLQQANAAWRGANARAIELETRHRRIADMYARNVVAKATLDQITAHRDSARADRDAAQAARAVAREGLGYTEVRAPCAKCAPAR